MLIVSTVQYMLSLVNSANIFNSTIAVSVTLSKNNSRVTNKVLAMARPNETEMKHHNMIEAFQK